MSSIYEFLYRMEGLRMQDYIFSNESYHGNDAIVYTCGHEECAPGHSYGPIARSGYLIHYVLRGKGIYRAHRKTYPIGEGDAFLIVPGELIYYEADQDDPWVYTWIGFQGIKIRDYLSRTTLLEHPVFRYDRDDRIRICHDKMYLASRFRTNTDMAMNSVLYEYLFLLAEKFPQTRISPEKRRNACVRETLEYMELHYENDISIQQIADRLYVSRTYLHRIFKETTGRSLKEHLIDIRMKRACRYLSQTDFPVSAIARSVGYEDPLYFSKLFRQKKGIPPTEYREQRSAPV